MKNSTNSNREYLHIPSYLITQIEINEFVYTYFFGGSYSPLKNSVLSRGYQIAKNFQDAEDLFQTVSPRFITSFKVLTLDVDHLKGIIFNWFSRAMRYQHLNNQRSKGNQDSRLDPSESDWQKMDAHQNLFEPKWEESEILICIGKLHPKIDMENENWVEEVLWRIENDIDGFVQEVIDIIRDHFPEIIAK